MKKIISYLTVSTIKIVRSQLYRRGFQPKRGSVFYSPSLEAMYILKKHLRNIKRK